MNKYLVIMGFLALTACNNSMLAPQSTSQSNTSNSSGTVETSSTATVDGVLVQTASGLTLNGQAVEVDAAAVQSQGVKATTLKAGMRIKGEATISGGKVTLKNVERCREALGAIEAIDTTASTITVLGQVISIASSTVLANEATDGSKTTITLADLAVGNYVEVYGTRSGSSVAATRIDRITVDSSYNTVELKGTATAVDTTSKTFVVNGYTINYSSATVTGTVTEGATIAFVGTKSGSTITASKVNVLAAAGEVVLHNSISSLDTTAKTFVLQGYTVDYNSATVTGALSNGVSATVVGTLNTSTNVVTAKSINVGDGKSKQVSTHVHGQITVMDTTAKTLTVANVKLWVDDSTVYQNSLTLGSLVLGQNVRAQYDASKTNASGALYAVQISNDTKKK